MCRTDWNGKCPPTDGVCVEFAQPPKVLTRTRKILTLETFIPNVLKKSKAMQKYVCGETTKKKTCDVVKTCTPRCKEEWSEWFGGCEDKYCNECCDLTQTRVLRMVDGVGMRGGTPPVEKRGPCLDKNYFWGYSKKMVAPTYTNGNCTSDYFHSKPWFPVPASKLSPLLLPLGYYIFCCTRTPI